MNLEETLIKRIRVTDVENLDPVTIMLEDFEPGKGKIVIECWGRSWSSFWPAMGQKNISDFFIGCNDDYLIRNLAPQIQIHEPDFDQFNAEIKKKICEIRRDSRGWDFIGGGLSKDLARQLYKIDNWESYVTENPYEPILCPLGIDEDEFEKLDFCELDVPEKLSTEYLYMQLIVRTVKAALTANKQQQTT
ncbi:hypothetical protein R7D97_25140 [Vibrio sp. Vb5031]|uniref:hypothetical protein n=1 Tax=Vibrio sp. Vb5031 TaxID=3074699 RepID=UPI00296460E2|nr:hypothetical protein [Vibrio sp. Vb5031]MDW1507478.1 hypothetical protein [Vibrio sp. Vb5031]